jgi:ribosomal-protein-alanine N-acetyltransferase
MQEPVEEVITHFAITDKKNYIEIRKAKLEDVEDLKKVCTEIWSEEETYPTEIFINLIKLDLSLIAIDTNKPVGFLLVKVDGDNLITIFTLGVLEEYRQRKIGRKLMIFCLDQCAEAGYTHFELHVETSNFPAIKLYESLGFLVEEKVKRYYERGQSAFIMRKALSEN